VIAVRNTTTAGVFGIYPNPVKEVLNIQLGAAATTGPIRIRITDASGKLVKSILVVSASSNMLTVPVGDLVPGIYFIGCNGSGSSFLKL
jgi:hypothetical protein